MKSKNTNVKNLQTQRNVDNTRGSKLWSYNHYRMSILTGLLNDLVDLENIGLDEDKYSLVRKSLEYFVNASTDIPKGGLLSGQPLYKDIEDFVLVFKTWNDIKGTSPESINKRIKSLKKLRKRKQAITDKIRSLQYEIQNNLDQKLLTDSYTALGKLINLGPDILKNLASSFNDYIKRGGMVA